ncbi:hypothetical protein EP073_09740 [Geovibrio thiophilus]|uniref:Uncharacterized protein n=1 Tax=Geovibrio thiophilus TaxID=139438 RepID=A0A3R5Y7L9_9BACT|nr:hypothetical protein [Geovibrio thiophilus]QAR33673.1 hypothetical protein EP073_09740 [Geovibrio thiophilus]
MIISASSGLYENLKISGLTQVSSGSKTEENSEDSRFASLSSVDKAEISKMGSFMVNMPEELQTDMEDFRNAIKEAAESEEEFSAESVAESASEELKTYAEEQGVSLTEMAQQAYDMHQNAPQEGMYGMQGGKPAGGPPPGGMPPMGESEETTTDETLLSLLEALAEAGEDTETETTLSVSETDESEEAEETAETVAEEENLSQISEMLLSALEKMTSTDEEKGSFEYKYSMMMNSLLFGEA